MLYLGYQITYGVMRMNYYSNVKMQVQGTMNAHLKGNFLSCSLRR